MYETGLYTKDTDIEWTNHHVSSVFDNEQTTFKAQITCTGASKLQLIRKKLTIPPRLLKLEVITTATLLLNVTFKINVAHVSGPAQQYIQKCSNITAYKYQKLAAQSTVITSDWRPK